MSEESGKAWTKAEDIPRRFDELPPGPEWVPVADVIRSHREETAKQEAKLHKIKPPPDSDSEIDKTKDKEKNKIKHRDIRDKDKKMVPKEAKPPSMPPTIDEVTDSMVKWALSTDQYPRRRPKPTMVHQYQSKPFSPSAGKKPHTKVNQERAYTSKESNKAAEEDYGAHASLQEQGRGHITGPRGDPRTQGTRVTPENPAGNVKHHYPPYLEPNPDYESEYYVTNQDLQYYDDDVYYYDYGYDDRYDDDEEYRYGSAYHYSPYVDHPGGYEYEYDGPKYQYEDQGEEYLHPQPYSDPYNHQHQRSQLPPRRDSLY